MVNMARATAKLGDSTRTFLAGIVGDSPAGNLITSSEGLAEVAPRLDKLARQADSVLVDDAGFFYTPPR
jgi:hypothetical protein